jgi:hypothetical protein
MKSHPPSLATWLLEHLIRREDNEALAGDLSEEFAQGRSVTWYWHQVFVAILVALSKELRTRWVTFLFAIIVSGVVSYRQIWHSFEFEGLFTWGIKLPWPVSLLFTIALWSAAEGLVFVVAFSAYLGAIRRFNLHSFLKGVLVALVPLSLGNLALSCLWIVHPPVVLFFTVIWRLPLFFSLVLATWGARPKVLRSESATRPI